MSSVMKSMNHLQTISRSSAPDRRYVTDQCHSVVPVSEPLQARPILIQAQATLISLPSNHAKGENNTDRAAITGCGLHMARAVLLGSFWPTGAAAACLSKPASPVSELPELPVGKWPLGDPRSKSGACGTSLRSSAAFVVGPQLPCHLEIFERS